MKRKKINRKQLIYTFIFFVFCVFGLTVAYAALATTLNISGSASVNSSEWDIVIEKYSIEDLYTENFEDGMYEFVCNNFQCNDNYLINGKASLLKEPTLLNTSIKDFSASLTTPGDRISIAYKVTNKGTLPTYTSSTNNTNDISLIQNYIHLDYVLTYGFSDADMELLEGNVLCPGQEAYLVFGCYFDEEATAVPSSAVQISNTGVDYVFTQTELNSCPS